MKIEIIKETKLDGSFVFYFECDKKFITNSTSTTYQEVERRVELFLKEIYPKKEIIKTIEL
jgi:hypothetical protein